MLCRAPEEPATPATPVPHLRNLPICGWDPGLDSFVDLLLAYDMSITVQTKRDAGPIDKNPRVKAGMSKKRLSERIWFSNAKSGNHHAYAIVRIFVEPDCR